MTLMCAACKGVDVSMVVMVGNVVWQGLEACVSLRRVDKARQLWGLATAQERGVEGGLEAYVAALLVGGEGREALEVLHRAGGQGMQVAGAHARLLQGEERRASGDEVWRGEGRG